MNVLQFETVEGNIVTIYPPLTILKRLDRKFYVLLGSSEMGHEITEKEYDRILVTINNANSNKDS